MKGYDFSIPLRVLRVLRVSVVDYLGKRSPQRHGEHGGGTEINQDPHPPRQKSLYTTQVLDIMCLVFHIHPHELRIHGKRKGRPPSATTLWSAPGDRLKHVEHDRGGPVHHYPAF